jgi:hypothetical protein
MKKLVEEVEGEGLLKFMGQRVMLMCSNYFYTGKLIGVNDDCVLLEDPTIVYETGEWTSKGNKDEQKLHAKTWYISRSFIESFGEAK